MRTKILSLGILTLILISCGDSKKNAVKTEHKSGKLKLVLDEKQMEHVNVVTMKRVTESEQLTAVGEVSFSEDNVVRIYPIVSGTVEKLFVSLGDYVTKGQTIATILSMDMSQIQRDYNIAKSNFSVEEKNLARAKELFEAGMMSEKEYANAKKDYSNALSEFNERTQILKLYGGSANDLDAIYNVVAPRSGYIVERNITEGTQIRNDNNTNIVTISDLKTVWVWVNVHESDMAKVREGDRVTVKTIAFPDKAFNGTVKKIGTMLDPDSRVIKVRTELSNENSLLKPEMFASIIITSQNKKTILAVPQAAVVLENNRFYVMQEKNDREFEKVVVTLGKTFGEFYEVTGGIKENDKVVSEGSLFVLTAFNQL
jgi:membrane fusion protein, heavy metal efflux system